MTDKKDKALKMARKALQSSQQYVEACANAKTKTGWGEQLDVAENAITAIDEALAEQPDIDWKDQYEKQKRRAEMWIAKYEEDIGPLEKAGPVTAQQQEPVAWFELLREARDNCKASIVEEGISASRKKYRIDLEARLTAALNTSPPASKPLTDEQIAEIAAQGHQRWLDFARGVEAAHGIKE